MNNIFDTSLEDYLDLQNVFEGDYSSRDNDFNPEALVQSSSVYFVILDVIWLILFIGGFVMTELRCNGLTRIIFRGKSVVIIASLLADISQRLVSNYNGSAQDLNMAGTRNVKHLIYLSIADAEKWSQNDLFFFYSMGKEFALLVDQGMSLIFFYFIHNCTCKMQVVEDPLKGVVRAINISLVVLSICSILQYIVTAFLPDHLDWLHQLNMTILPLGKVLVTIITFTAIFWGVKTLRALTKSRRFQKTCGSKVSNRNTFLMSIVASMLFTQFVKFVVQVIKITYQFTGEDWFLTCFGNPYKSFADENQCFIDHTNASRLLSVTISSPWYNLAEYVSVLVPLVYNRFKKE